jgi:hypothetical protein
VYDPFNFNKVSEIRVEDVCKFAPKKNISHSNVCISKSTFLNISSSIKIQIVYVIPWQYHYVYIDRNLNIFYDHLSPEFDKKKCGYYHKHTSARCIGSFFVGDGYIFEFKILTPNDHDFGNYEIYQLTRTDKFYNRFHILLDRLMKLF